MEEINFNGKTVSFSTQESTLVISNPVLNKINNKLFLVGSIPLSATTNDWAKDKVCAVALDTITDYIIFDSEAEYIKQVALS